MQGAAWARSDNTDRLSVDVAEGFPVNVGQTKVGEQHMSKSLSTVSLDCTHLGRRKSHLSWGCVVVFVLLPIRNLVLFWLGRGGGGQRDTMPARKQDFGMEVLRQKYSVALCVARYHIRCCTNHTNPPHSLIDSLPVLCCIIK
jgi:hypothetical protein